MKTNKKIEYTDKSGKRILFNNTRQSLRILNVLKSKFKGKCLDIGTDNGRNLYLMPKNSIGLDFYDNYFDEIKNRGYIPIKCDLNKGILPFKDEEFDTILFSHCLEHVIMPNEILKEVKRVLKKSGTLIIGVPNIKCIHTDFYSKEFPDHINVYDAKTLKKSLEHVGFKIKRRYCNFPTKYYIMYLIFNYSPLRYYWDDIFYICNKG